MNNPVLALLLFSVVTTVTQVRAEIYKCSNAERTIFSDSPCGESAEIVDISAAIEKTGTQFSNREMDALGHELGQKRRAKELDRDIVRTQKDIDRMIDDYTVRKARLETELAAHNNKLYRYRWQHYSFKRNLYYETQQDLKNQIKIVDREFKANREKAYNRLTSLRQQRNRLD